MPDFNCSVGSFTLSLAGCCGMVIVRSSTGLHLRTHAVSHAKTCTSCTRHAYTSLQTPYIRLYRTVSTVHVPSPHPHAGTDPHFDDHTYITASHPTRVFNIPRLRFANAAEHQPLEPWACLCARRGPRHGCRAMPVPCMLRVRSGFQRGGCEPEDPRRTLVVGVLLDPVYLQKRKDSWEKAHGAERQLDLFATLLFDGGIKIK